MANPEGTNRTPPEDYLRLRGLMPEFRKPDGTPNIRGLATALDWDRKRVSQMLDRIRVEDLEAAQRAYTPDIDGIEIRFEEKPRVRVRAYNVSVTADLPVRRVCAIGDLHMAPGVDFQHMTWIGRHVAETRPDNVIQIGDAFDMESCEFHSAPGSAANSKRPAVIEDIEAGEEVFDAYHKEVGLGEVPHDVVLGNHENRAWRLEEAAPNLRGTVTLQIEQFFARYRWKVTPYRHWIFMEGVGFSHVPISIMGKPIGGRYPENNIGNQTTHSIVFGHTHRQNHVTVPKIGVNNSITVTNVGSAMPHGFVPRWADGNTTGWTYGIADLRLRGGRVESANFISILELREKYGR